MWQIMAGFAIGVYVGTEYDCKSSIEFIKTCIKDKIPKDAFPKKKE